MAKQVAPGEVHAWFKEHFREHPNIGAWKVTLDLILQLRNPFEPEKRRWPKRGFLVGVGIVLSAVGWLYHFNFRR